MGFDKDNLWRTYVLLDKTCLYREVMNEHFQITFQHYCFLYEP